MTYSKIDLNLHISVLGKYNVEYVVVGGIGAMAYGATRPTQDLDSVVEHGDAKEVELEKITDAVASKSFRPGQDRPPGGKGYKPSNDD